MPEEPIQQTAQDTAQTSDAGASPIAAPEQGATTVATENRDAIRAAISGYAGESPTPDADDGDTTDVVPAAQASPNVLDGIDPGLLDAGRRMAGLDDEGIKAMLTANKAAGMKVLENARNAQHRIASEFGRQNKPSETDEPKPAAAAPKQLREVMKKKLEAVTSDEDAVNGLLEVLDLAVSPLESKLSDINKASEQQRELMENEQMALAAERLLPSLSGGEALYGKGDFNTVAPELQAVRVKVFSKARQIQLGAEKVGAPVSWDSALREAHYIEKNKLAEQAEQQRVAHGARAQHNRRSIQPVSGRVTTGVTNAVDPKAEIRRAVNGYLGR